MSAYRKNREYEYTILPCYRWKYALAEILMSVLSGLPGNTNSGLLDSCDPGISCFRRIRQGLNLTAEIVETSDGEIKSTAMYPQYDFRFFGKCAKPSLETGRQDDALPVYDGPAVQYGACTDLEHGMLGKSEQSRRRNGEIRCYRMAGAGMNIHRNPLCGRVLNIIPKIRIFRRLAAALTEGVQSHPGKFVSLKHFCANNSQAKRDHPRAI